MNEKYDLAFSIGQACACSTTLRAARLQFASFPFDWLSRASLKERIAVLVQRFDHWLDKDDFIYEGINPENGMGTFLNRRTGFKHLHDFADGPIEQSHAEVVAKYARREKRLLGLIVKSNRVLVVYLDRARPGGNPRPTTDEIIEARADIAAAFPNAAFDMIHFIMDREIPYERRIVTRPAEGVTEIRFDYHNDMTDVSHTLTSKALLALGISVKDYRTDEERKAHKLRNQMKKYGVETRWGLFWAKLRAKVPFLRGRSNITPVNGEQ